MAGQLSQDEISSFRDAFSLFDKDGDGTITINELGEVMGSLGLDSTEDERRSMMEEVDTDRNGTIDFTEFLTMMAAHGAADSEGSDELQAAFNNSTRTGTVRSTCKS
ncbi:hypothetical protein M378DRAFT_368565 [Amanita muscaria Koide BX008]|uniref:EF-hand domain-containing protein n=1 Tax=Amanita muscaria (strain Koide BX008) TaxID=946122 RepID=A0A0C2WXP5_AMAMK|nr:hypothetical protein M378DRAFT_368565 [Amanita muscaria Koide BX008]